MPRRVGNGPGWGGPARSSDKSDKRKPFRPGNPGGTGGAKGYWGGGPIRSETRIASAVECKERITEVMRSPEVLEKYPTATIKAAEAMLDRLEGMPTQRSININLEEGVERRRVVEALKALDPAALDAAEAALRAAGMRLPGEDAAD